MKKLFTTLFALLGITFAANAATVDDIKPMLHSYVCVFDNYTGNGTVARTKGGLFGGGYFLDVTGGSIATNKGSVDLADTTTFTAVNGADVDYIAANYAKYGKHVNSLRLKNAQDVIAFKPTAGSKVYVFGHGNNKVGTAARVPKFAKDAALTEPLNDAPTAEFGKSGIYVYVFEVPAEFDGSKPIYVGSYNGDAFFSYIIVEANEPAGTPAVELGVTNYDEASKLYYQEISCTPKNYILDGFDLGPTEVYYTTDGTEPTTASTKYTEPIKCYKDMTVKFQAFFEGAPLDGANNEASSEFIFNVPTLTVDGATATISTEYFNATNYYSIDGAEAVAGDTYTATTSCLIEAYTEIKNGDYATWKTGLASAPIYVLDPIKEKKVITITGKGVVDEEATAADKDGNTIYMAEDAKLLINGNESDPSFYLVPDATFKAIMVDTAQVNGQEVYLQMDKPNLTFKVAEGDSIDVTVTVSKNSHKDAKTLQTYVNVNGTTYGHENILESGNVIKFGLTGGIYTFQKYSGTGNIHVASIEFSAPMTSGITSIENEEADANAPIFDLAGRKVANPVKGIYVKSGKKFIVK